MAILVCHSPKGGAGASFIASQLALRHAETGQSVCLVTTTAMASPAPYLGRPYATVIPPLSDRSLACSPGSVDLRCHVGAAGEPDLGDLLQDLDVMGARGRLVIVDVGAGQHALAARLAGIATLRLGVLTGAPDALAMLPAMLPAPHDEPDGARDLFVLNAVDETRRIERHGAAFARELMGARLLGRIRRDVCVIEAFASLQPLSAYAPASTALADVRALADGVAKRLGDRADAMAASPMPLSSVLAA